MPTPALADLARVARARLPEEPTCPQVPDGYQAVFLLDAATGLEDRLLRSWIERTCPIRNPVVLNVTPSRIRRRKRETQPEVAAHSQPESPSWLIPLRVVWMPAERHGRRAVSWLDVLKLGDPRDPRWLRDYLILKLFPDRVQIAVGDGAGGSELASDHTESTEHFDLVTFVTRRAWRALDRAEREHRGDRYKIPRFVAEDIVSRPSFREEAVAEGRERGLPPSLSFARARYYVSEIAASHSPFLIDLIANLIHWVIRQGYGAIHYDRAAIQRIARLGSDSTLVFLPSHKSNLDRLSLQFMLWENDMPPNHTAGGINMNFFPVGPLVRRTGVFFIRRSFKNNNLYKFVLRTYLDYLIERRFPLEWYMEGGRSRSGKLRPPRYGMLSWVVDSFARGTADDIYLVPISIAYDQIQEVGAYVAEATGGTKEKETFSWALKFARSLRRRYGDIHIRFGEPISVAAELAGTNLTDDDPIEVQKMAFEVMYRISLATPVTPTSVLATVLLACKGDARDIDGLAAESREIVSYIDRRELPTTVAKLPKAPPDIATTIALMIEHGLLSAHGAGGRTVYWMEPSQKLRASYYANTIVHFFVPRGLAEIALAAPDLNGFWSDLVDLRDFFKFEFFFADRDEFRSTVRKELTDDSPGWEQKVSSGRGDEVVLVPSTVKWAVLPLLESYLVVADELAAWPGAVDKEPFLAACLERGRLYRLEGRITSDESVSQVAFGGALLLAENRGLTSDDPGAASGRLDFAAQVSGYIAAANRR